MRLQDKDWVFRQESEGRFRRIAVQAGAVTSDGMQEVSGVAAGDQVILDALDFSTAVAEKKD